MNYKPLFLTLFYLATICTSLAQKEQSPPDVEQLHDVLLKDFGVLQEYPDDPFVWVLFFDLDHDGIPEAFATYKGDDYTGSGGGGCQWSFYRFKDGKWQRGLQKSEDGSASDSATIGAHPWYGLFSLTREGQKPSLVVSSPFRGKEDNGMTFTEDVSEVTVDNNGYLKVVPIPELSVNYSAPWDDEKWGYVSPDLGAEYDALQKRLVSVSAEMFFPTDKTILLERRDDGWYNTTLTNNYTWQKPIKGVIKVEMVTTNTAMLPTVLQETIRNTPNNTWNKPGPFLPDTIAMMQLDVDGKGIPAFLMDVNREDFRIGDRCYVIFGKTGKTYSELGHIRKGFTEFALHEKTNGWHSMEFRFPPIPVHLGGRPDVYVRELYVFDGKQYNLAVRSWCKNDTEDQEGETQVSSSNREGEAKLEIRNEELGIEKQETPNRLWLYLAVLPFILAIIYLMRKKK